MAANCWGNEPVPGVELYGAIIQSSIIANGPVTSVVCDNMSLDEMNRRLERTVGETLNNFKLKLYYISHDSIIVYFAHTTSNFGQEIINFPPFFKYSDSLSLNSFMKCQGNIP